MGIIHLLDSELSNKIAAGEVVERPASVVKELVENSIDAGAAAITVELSGGGVSYLRVSDNGKGMSGEDAKICFLRHATSKISTDEDLEAIYTLGFRGEALSSIGAVARVSLYTKQRGGDGICVTCCGGEVLSSEEAGIPDGTSVIVEDLFYNTPARLKFLKKDSTEAGYITDIMTRTMFAHPEISFKLIINGKEKLFSPGDSSLKNAVYTAYGKDYAKGMIEVDYEANGIRVTGLIGKGNVSRPNRNYQSFFVNKRYIKSAMIFRAVEDAYKNQIMIGKFPVAVLNIEISPQLMDINVHPTKLEVKFANEKDVRNAVYYGVKNALYALPNVPEISRVDEETGEVFFEAEPEGKQLDLTDMVKALPKTIREFPKRDRKPSFAAKGGGSDKTYAAGTGSRKADSFAVNTADDSKSEIGDTRLFFNDAAVDMQKREREEPVLNDGTEEKAEIKPQEKKIVSPDMAAAEAIEEAAEITADASDDNAIVSPKEETVFLKAENVSPAADNVFVEEYFRVVGQVFDTYIIVEKGDRMLMIDQHAAHERLNYEALRRDMESKQVMCQMLLEPVIVRLSPTEIDTFTQCRDELNDMGFDCDEFGENEVIVRGVPGEIEEGEVEELLLTLITNSARSKHELIPERREYMLYTIACKSAIKANRRLSAQEMETLARDVFAMKNINTCPHGRPIVISMTKKEIEKEFKRIV